MKSLVHYGGICPRGRSLYLCRYVCLSQVSDLLVDILRVWTLLFLWLQSTDVMTLVFVVLCLRIGGMEGCGQTDFVPRIEVTHLFVNVFTRAGDLCHVCGMYQCEWPVCLRRCVPGFEGCDVPVTVMIHMGGVLHEQMARMGILCYGCGCWSLSTYEGSDLSVGVYLSVG